MYEVCVGGPCLARPTLSPGSIFTCDGLREPVLTEGMCCCVLSGEGAAGCVMLMFTDQWVLGSCLGLSDTDTSGPHNTALDRQTLGLLTGW